MAIHPTAVVEPGAEIAQGCEIGPFAVVGANVKLGAGTSVGAHALVAGHTTVGQGNRIFPFAALGGVPQDLKYRGEPTRLEIGDRNVIREFVTLNRGTTKDRGVTTIGDDNLFMSYSHVAHDCIVGNQCVLANCSTLGGHVVLVIGSGCLFMANSHVGHDCRVADGAIVANSVALAGHVTVEDHVHLSGLAAVHQFVRIGRLSFVSGLTGVTMDVAPYTTVAGPRAELGGLNAVGMQRAGFTEEQLGRVKQAYKIVFRSGLGLAEAIAELEKELAVHVEIAHLVAFLKGTQRGVTR
jgi:UDP-N-acetylglucosamine acyltransferase